MTSVPELLTGDPGQGLECKKRIRISHEEDSEYLMKSLLSGVYPMCFLLCLNRMVLKINLLRIEYRSFLL
jgi:hypothetical protein